MVLDTALLNSQHYKVLIKGKVEQYRESSSALPYTGIVAIERVTLGSPSTTVANLTYFIKYYGHFVSDNLICPKKSGKHLHVTYRNSGQLFRLYLVSSAVYTVIFPTGNRTSDYRMQSGNSTTEPTIHIAHQ